MAIIIRVVVCEGQDSMAPHGLTQAKAPSPAFDNIQCSILYHGTVLVLDIFCTYVFLTSISIR